MTSENIYTRNRPLLNSILTGLFYFGFCWTIDFGDTTKFIFMSLMLFLPGITFPLTTSFFTKDNEEIDEGNKILHVILSVLIYHGSVWLFSAKGKLMYITIFAGVLGSFLYQLSSKYILKKKLTLVQVYVTAFFSGLSFIPYEFIKVSGLMMGVSVILWTIINGTLLNIEYNSNEEFK